MTDRYLERVALCRIPGRLTTLKKRLAAIKAEAADIRAEVARLERVKDAIAETPAKARAA